MCASWSTPLMNSEYIGQYYSMISTSFLRTLNLKKYQEFAEENKNRLKVFYIRTVAGMKKKVTLEHKPKPQAKTHSSSKSSLDRSNPNTASLRQPKRYNSDQEQRVRKEPGLRWILTPKLHNISIFEKYQASPKKYKFMKQSTSMRKKYSNTRSGHREK